MTRISLHGGHSGQFCVHAEDDLEDIVKEYIRQGFRQVGLTEHAPPPKDKFLYQDEVEAGLDAAKLYENFKKYIEHARFLQEKYQDQIKIYVGFESETYPGYEKFTKNLINAFKPDYFVGSIHHVNDMQIDGSREQYGKVAEKCGGIDQMYEDYFDSQGEMLEKLKPPVVGHFDLIRIFDPDYQNRLKKPKIWRKIVKNLQIIAKNDLIMDFNMRALCKGHKEPYVSLPILQKAHELGIRVVPGDDSHGIKDVGLNLEKGMKMLEKMGFETKPPNFH